MIDRVMSTLFRVADGMKVTPGKSVDKIQQQPFSLEQSLTLETAKELTKTQRSGEVKSPEQLPLPDRQDQLPYVPLPLRSPLYEATRFYWKLKDFSALVGDSGEAKVIFSIHTDTLGLLWFTVTAQPSQGLAVQCITDIGSSAEVFRAGIPLLQQELSQLGYANVVVSCRIQPGVRTIADIDPDFSSNPQSLLNVQV